MFKSKNDNNGELFTPLLQTDAHLPEELFFDQNGDVDHAQVGASLTEPAAHEVPLVEQNYSADKFRQKLHRQQQKMNELQQKRKKVFDYDPEDAARRPESYKYYIVSLVVPLIVFLFALVVLCFFIISPILQGVKAVNDDKSHHVPMDGHAESQDDHHHHHENEQPLGNTQPNGSTPTSKNDSLSSSVKKDGVSDEHKEHSHHD